MILCAVQNVAPSNNSEAFFIASRLQQQDQQLAEHTAAATNCPLLKLSTETDPTAADTDAGVNGENGEPAADQPIDLADSVDGGSEAAASATTTPGGTEPQAAPVPAAAGGAGAGAGLQLQPLQPLLPVCVTGAQHAHCIMRQHTFGSFADRAD